MWPFGKRKKTRVLGFSESFEDVDYNVKKETDSGILDVPFQGRTIKLHNNHIDMTKIFEGCSSLNINTFKGKYKNED